MITRTVPPKLILEGTDGVGKTTIALRIAEATGAAYIHAGAPTHDTIQGEYLDELDHERVVLDRWHLGEWVWPGLMGRLSLYASWESVVSTSRRIADKGYVVWVVTRPPLEIMATLRERGESSGIVASIIAQRQFELAAERLRDRLGRDAIQIVPSDELWEVERWRAG